MDLSNVPPTWVGQRPNNNTYLDKIKFAAKLWLVLSIPHKATLYNPL